jgi:hypothetical protein
VTILVSVLAMGAFVGLIYLVETLDKGCER